MQTYPSTLPLMTKNSKTRREDNSFRIADAQNGPGYTESITSDTPTYFTGTLVLSRSQYVTFRTFFAAIRRGLDPFNMPIWVESGIRTQKVQIVPGSFREVSDTGTVFTISFNCFVREVDQVAEYEGYLRPFIEILGWDYPNFANVLDIAINRDWPEA